MEQIIRQLEYKLRSTQYGVTVNRDTLHDAIRAMRNAAEELANVRAIAGLHPLAGKRVTVYTGNVKGAGFWTGTLRSVDPDYIYLDGYIIAREPGMYIKEAK